MVIREISRKECLRVLAGARLARLACAHDNQPYVVPIYLAYDEVSGCLYGFTTSGQKIEWMRANPLVCVEVDEIVAADQWVSVIGMGRYTELPETTGSEGVRLRAQERPQDDRRYREWDQEGCEDERDRAWQALKSIHPLWWEPGCTAWAARVHRDPAAPLVLIYFRISLDQITGHKATRDARDAISDAVSAPPTGRGGWLRGTLMRVFGGRQKSHLLAS
jgi:hypothetical protein